MNKENHAGSDVWMMTKVKDGGHLPSEKNEGV